MSKQIIAALQEVNVSIFLLCNQSVCLNKRDILIDAVKNHQSNKSSADNQEVLTSVVIETIERKTNEKLKVSVVPTVGPQILPTGNKEIQNKRLVEDNGVRIRGNEESKNEDPRKRAESDRSEVKAILSFLNINTQINDYC